MTGGVPADPYGFGQAGHATNGYYGASIMPVEVLLELQRRLPNVKFWNFYGQTEIAPLGTVLRPEDQLRKAGSAGKPVINVETRVVNTSMEDVKVGEIGEIVHRSPHLLSGYYNDPVKTAAAFSGGCRRSRDRRCRRLYHRGRSREGYDQNWRRERCEPRGRGDDLQDSAVSVVAVVGLPDPRWIEAVTAIIVIKSRGEARRGRRRQALCGRDGAFQSAETRDLRRQPAQARAPPALRDTRKGAPEESRDVARKSKLRCPVWGQLQKWGQAPMLSKMLILFA